MTHYKIDVVSDTVCPWCYVGKNRMDIAIKKHQATNPDDTFTTNWLPFQLAPNAGASVDKQAHYEQKFGAQRTAVMQQHLARLGKQVGIDFAFGGKTGNTRDSHRLIELAKSKGEDAQNKVVEALFTAYFEANEDITSQDVLVARAVEAGLDEQEVKDYLRSDIGGDKVDREIAKAQSNSIGGVPNFTINGQYEIQGAEEPAAFLQVFEMAKNKSGSSGDVINGSNTC